MRLIDGNGECNFLDNRCRWRITSASPRHWNRMQRFGIGSEGETGAFKCLTLSTLSPAPDAGPFLPLGARHRAALIQIRRRRSSNYLTMIEDC